MSSNSSGRRWVVASDEGGGGPPTSEVALAPQSVAIIGGGIAGLACAARLSRLGLKAVVFDTGKRGPGGRASSRFWHGHIVDHAAQFAAATDPEFATALRVTGAAARWGDDGRFGVLSGEGFRPISDGVERWIGVRGMGCIVEAFARDVDLRADVWVPPSHGIRREGSSWGVVVPDGRARGTTERFDAVVIAHNGKCAERLTSGTPATEIHALLRTDFSAHLSPTAPPGSGKFTLNQVYSLLFEVPAGIMPANFDAAIVESDPTLRWLSSNTAKYARQRNGTAPNTEAWTALSSANFGRKHKVPQEQLENLPKKDEVTSLMLEAIERVLKLGHGVVQGKVIDTKLQLWGAALPINRWESPDKADFVWCAAHSIGIVGDWITAVPQRASTVEAAWLSGTRLAEHIAGSGCSRDVGLQLGDSGGKFVPVDGDFGDGGREAKPMWVTVPFEGEPSGGTDAKGSKGSKGTKGGGGGAKGSGRGKGGGGGDWKGYWGSGGGSGGVWSGGEHAAAQAPAASTRGKGGGRGRRWGAPGSSQWAWNS